MARGLLLGALVLAGAATASAQMFGDLPAAPPRDTCPYTDFQARTQVVQDACCPDPADCAVGLPDACSIACGAVFVNFFHDCETLMETVMGHAQTHSFSDFDKVCKRQDAGELLMMVYSMATQGCSIEAIDPDDAAQLHEDTQMDEDAMGVEQFGLGGAAQHFANELAQCEWDDVSRKIDIIEHACCNERDSDDSCTNHLPENCDLECAVAFVPFHEDCRTVIAGPLHDQLAGFDTLYHTCQASTRQDTLGLLRAIYDTQEHYDDNEGVPPHCPVRGSLEFFSDCPGQEAECIMQYIGSNTTLSNLHVYSSYRFNVHSNQGRSGLLCHDEIFFAGPGMCRHELDANRFTSGPDIVTGYTCTEAAVAEGREAVAEDTAACAAITGAALSTPTACEAVLTASTEDDPATAACVYNEPVVRDHASWYSSSYLPQHLGDSPQSIMQSGGSGAAYCSYPQTYWYAWNNNPSEWADLTIHTPPAQCDPNNPTGLNDGWVGPERPTFGRPELCEHWLRYDFEEPTQVDAYVVKARNANEAMSDFEWQGSNDGETWTTIETRHVNNWVSNEPQVFIVGSPLYEEAAPGVPQEVFDAAFLVWDQDESAGGVETCSERDAGTGGH